jgi:hypothetical protein
MKRLMQLKMHQGAFSMRKPACLRQTGTECVSTSLISTEEASIGWSKLDRLRRG